MEFLAWYTGFLPHERRENGVKLGIGSFATTTIAALALFFSVMKDNKLLISSSKHRKMKGTSGKFYLAYGCYLIKL
jgi:hypothetical protein